jgi:hypothetical protein
MTETDREHILRAWNALPRWTRDMLIWCDKRLNEKYGNKNPDMTVSEHLARSRNAGHWEGQFGCMVLDQFDPGHCDRAIPITHKEK